MKQPEGAPDPRVLIEKIRRAGKISRALGSTWHLDGSEAEELAAALESALDRAETAEADAAKARAALAVVIDRFPLNEKYRKNERAREAKAEAVRQMLRIPAKSWPDGLLHRGAFGRVGAAARAAWEYWNGDNEADGAPTIAPPPLQLVPGAEARLNSHLGAAIVQAIACIPPEGEEP